MKSMESKQGFKYCREQRNIYNILIDSKRFKRRRSANKISNSVHKVYHGNTYIALRLLLKRLQLFDYRVVNGGM